MHECELDNIDLESTEVKQESQEASENDQISATEDLSQKSSIECLENLPIYVNDNIETEESHLVNISSVDNLDPLAV